MCCSWVPVPTPGLMSTTRRRLGSIVDRIDALLDEVGMTRMQLLLLIEERFQLTINPAEMTRERFTTASALAGFLGEKRRLAA